MAARRPAPAENGYCQHCGTPLDARWHEDRLRPTCSTCGFVHFLDPKVAVAVIVGDDHGILLARRNIDPARGRWSFPAGYVNRGEVIEEAAVREVAEEMDVAIQLAGLVGVYSERDQPVVLVVYAGELAGGHPRPDGREVTEVARFPLDALPPLAFPHDRRIVDDWRQLRLRGRPPLTLGSDVPSLNDISSICETSGHD